MKYRSTRGQVCGLGFQDAVLAGYASDGGMLLPETIPELSNTTIKEWAKLPYKEIVKKISSIYVGDEISSADLEKLIDSALSRDKFSHVDIAPVKRLPGGLNILELFHGKTFAFKDYALNCTAQFLNYFLEKRKAHITAIVATSGDTGSAAIESVRSLPCVDIIVLLPRGRIARIQELQMTTVIEDNVHVFRVDGTSDDLEVPMKNLFTDSVFTSKHNICSINSVNWSRIMVQIAHFFYAYFQACPQCDQTVQMVVPSGGGGNICAGLIAQMMGLPLKLRSSVNVNDTLADMVQNGKIVKRDVVLSLAPAMDIQIPYNLERVLYLLSGADGNKIKALYTDLEKNGRVSIPQELHEKLKETVKTFVAPDDVIKSTMKKCWDENQYLLCPHTATAVAYHYSHSNCNFNRMCIATASPAKFEEAVTAAGLKPQPPDAIKQLYAKPTKYTDVERDQDWDAILRAKIEDITNRIKSK